MASKNGLAKLTRPRLAGVQVRERLFARLDECRPSGAVWVHGPPGAGKTTLVASWLADRRVNALWYQVDAGDADPASFFHHLSLGVRQASATRALRLPQLTPEVLGDIGGFARRYFRVLYQALPRPWLLVLDNVQDAGDASPFGTLLHEALAALPEGLNVIAISREQAPSSLARLRASQALAEIGWDELRLTDEEATRIAVAALPPTTQDVDALVLRCDGWAAGLTLLLYHARSAGMAPGDAGSQQALFDYFAAELFDRLAPDMRHLLLRTALLPWVDAEMARTLSDNSRAAALLERLHRQQLFTERRDGSSATYRYHALFREFLKVRLREASSASDHLRLAHKSARLLERADELDEAFRLYREAGDDGAAAALVLANAARLAAQGRIQTLVGWIVSLPPASRAELPWLGCWLGLCQLGADSNASRAQLEEAYHRFEASADVLGQVVSAAGIIESHTVAFGDFSRTDAWADILLNLLARAPAFPDPGLELNVLASLFGAMSMRQPDRPELRAQAERIRVLVADAPDVNSRLLGAARLLQYEVFVVGRASAERLIARIQPQLDDPALSGLNACTWLHTVSLHHLFAAFDPDKALQVLDEALALMERDGLRFLATTLHSLAAMVHLARSDLAAAAAHLERGVPARDDVRFDIGWHDGMQAWLAQLQGRPLRALEHARELVRINTCVGTRHPLGMALLVQANVLAAAGRHGEALASLRQAREHVTRMPFGSVSVDLVEAHLLLAHDDVDAGDAARTLLRRAFALMREAGVLNTLQWLPGPMAALCAHALAHDIEPDTVRSLIRHRGLRAPADAPAAWPWPVVIRSLGSFDVLVDGQPLQAQGKAQRKPLALLKALVALGGRKVAEDKLIEAVWVDPLEGDEHKAFDITVHRLRKLLKHERCLQVSDRQLSLDPELVWVDLWALEHRLGDALPAAPLVQGAAGALEQVVREVLALYRGAFLAGEPDSACILPVRNRLAGRFQRFVLQLGEHWEHEQQWDRASALYERAIELDPLAETFYRKLMVCLHEQGQCAEALDVYHRCRHILSVTLGVWPVESTEAVHRALSQQGPRPVEPNVRAVSHP